MPDVVDNVLSNEIFKPTTLTVNELTDTFENTSVALIDNKFLPNLSSKNVSSNGERERFCVVVIKPVAFPIILWLFAFNLNVANPVEFDWFNCVSTAAQKSLIWLPSIMSDALI